MLYWEKYREVATRYEHKAKVEDKEDLNHTIILSLAQAQLSLERNGGHQLSDMTLLRIASHEVADYWRTQYKFTNGLDCGSCSQSQRRKCRSDWLYPECPKAIKLEYLEKPIIDTEGNLTELGQLIADDQAIDLDAWLEAKTWLLGCPKRLLDIAHKRLAGLPLNATDDKYLDRFRQKERRQMSLF
jgi:hypothetical protein